MVALPRTADTAPIARPSPRPIPLQALKGLIAGMILRCLEDLSRWAEFHGGNPPNRSSQAHWDSLRAARHAIRWLNGQQANGISFVDCCDALAVNPDFARERMLSLIDATALHACGGWQTQVA